MSSRNDAIRKAMDYLGVRDHSEDEIRVKLERCQFISEDIEAAIEYVRQGGWLLPPDVLSEKVAETLHRKQKSHLYILAYLESKKLPAVRRESSREKEKALSLIRGRLSNRSSMDKKQIVQFLKNRGFDLDTITRVIHETSGHSKSF